MARVRARFEKNGAIVQQRAGGAWVHVEPRTDWTRVDATTAAEISRQIANDEAEATKDSAAWARRVRRRAALTQVEFARRIGVPVATIRDWERGRCPPAGAARALLRVIDRMPEAALAVLAA